MSSRSVSLEAGLLDQPKAKPEGENLSSRVVDRVEDLVNNKS